MYIPTITIVTPCLNAVGTIDQTISSVVNQAGPFNIHYHIQDGGSTDGTWERVQWWKRHVASSHFLRHCNEILFTAAQEEDTGLYDAIVKGFEKTHPPSHGFMTWINADDLLFQGALALVADFEKQFPSEKASWVGGATALVKDSRIISFWDTPKPTKALRHGLCEGTHWEFLQQEGVFFRGWLWRAAKAHKWMPKMKLAGDWNLWRLFAQHASLVQCNYPIGAFRVREGQLSGTQRGNYIQEIDSILSPEERKSKLGEIVENGTITRRLARSHYPNTNLHIYEEDIHRIAVDRFTKIFGKAPQSQFPFIDKTLLYKGEFEKNDKNTKSNNYSQDKIEIGKFTFAYNAEWQFPAITEKHAYESLKRLWMPHANSAGYVAFPWATAIDHMQSESLQAADWYRLLHRFADRLGEEMPAIRKVTVCQHIKLKEYLHLFKSCGVTDIFWSHCTINDHRSLTVEGMTLHPFPLYPVQQVSRPASDRGRNLLFSFVGAASNDFYLTKSRNWIFQHLQGFPAGFVGRRDSWHYSDVVYNKQIGKGPSAENKTNEQDKEKEFRDLLTNSIFSLCPSGTGPNSIRLWESLGAGAIPVILADTYLPPGPLSLWEEAAVFCPETEEAIAALPAKLEAMAKDTALLEKKRRAMKCLWLKYGPDCFVYDVLKFLMEKDALAAAQLATSGKITRRAEDSLAQLAEDVVASRLSPREAAPLVWRGLYTRGRTSPEALRTLLAAHPEIVQAATLSYSFLPADSRHLARHEALRSIPGLDKLPTLAS